MQVSTFLSQLNNYRQIDSCPVMFGLVEIPEMDAPIAHQVKVEDPGSSRQAIIKDTIFCFEERNVL